MHAWFSASASTLHILGITCMFGATFVRGRLLARPFTQGALDHLLLADSISGIGALMTIGSGLWRLLGGLDKATAFYLFNGMFYVKLSLLAVAIAIELTLQKTVFPWQMKRARKEAIDTASLDPAWLRAMGRRSDLMLVVAVSIVFVAPVMARGLWLVETSLFGSGGSAEVSE
jgi:uncharacterized membrane protein